MSAVHPIWLGGALVHVEPSALIGEGGEAEVYALDADRVVKLWKAPDHPDFAGQPDAQAVAARRIACAPARLAALPALPSAVVAVDELAYATANRDRACGYAMKRVAGTSLHLFGEPRWRRDHPIAGAEVARILLALHDAIAGLHRAGVVIGDCNDLNILVDTSTATARVHLIDVDSYQHGAHACAMFSERFVDPRLCARDALAPVRPHDRDSDWYAFAAIAFRTLLGVGPWGGVDPAHHTLAARVLARVSAMSPQVVYPRAARAIATLTENLVSHFRDVFERDVRGEFPRALLVEHAQRMRPCAACGEDHARAICPSCHARAAQPAARITGSLRIAAITRAAFAASARTIEVTRTSRPVWLDGGALWRTTRLGGERVGSVVLGHSRAWVGARLGVGFYRAGGYAAGFVFRPDRAGLADTVALPPIRGELISAHAACADDRAWLTLVTARNGKIETQLIAIAADTRVLAVASGNDARWSAGLAGAVAIGAHLFVPTDDGIVRLEVAPGANGANGAKGANGAPGANGANGALASPGSIECTRVFTDTVGHVGAADQLAHGDGGIDVLRSTDAVRLHLG